MKYIGSCLCGEVQYELEGEFDSFFLCHCKSCRKDTGSAHAANLFSSNAKLEWLNGVENIKKYNHNNSGHIKTFCKTCGSALPNVQMEGKLIVVPAGSLDIDLDIMPTGHIYLNEKANWDDNLELIKKYGELPNDE